MKRNILPRVFHARLTGKGTISLPTGLREDLRPGQMLRIRIELPETERDGTAGEPGDEEIIQIAMRQAATPDIIRKSLGTQGVLSGSRAFTDGKRRMRGSGA